MLKQYGWSPARCIPHGGHQMSLNIAAGLGLGGNESYPGIFQPFGGFADDIPVQDSYVTPPKIPGIGFEAKPELSRVLHTLLDTCNAKEVLFHATFVHATSLETTHAS